MRAPTAEAGRIRDYYASRAWRGSGAADMLVAERRALLESAVLRRSSASDLRICDVGCGAGGDLARWAELGVPQRSLFGTELLEDRAEQARATLPTASISTVDGFRIPHPDASFDVVTANLVLSSITDAVSRRALLAEMRRVARPTGVIAIYDFRIRKPWNRGVVAIRGGDLSSVLGAATTEHRVGPFLPLLDVALRLPPRPRATVIAVLPRTHRLWIWGAK